jgi:hypothetical protein
LARSIAATRPVSFVKAFMGVIFAVGAARLKPSRRMCLS